MLYDALVYCNRMEGKEFLHETPQCHPGSFYWGEGAHLYS